jgi:hypothetical protein
MRLFDLRQNMYLALLAFSLMVSGLVLGLMNGGFIEGYFKISFSSSVLLSDYITIGGLGPTLFNVGSLMGLSYLIVRKLDLEINGPLFAGVLTIGGFAFFGKNLLNVSLIYLGVFLYARLKKKDLRDVLVVFLFATGISPISSVLMFGFDLPYILGLPLGIMVGILSGFLLVELSSHVHTFHKGYNLYNVGFACGIFALFYTSIFDLFGLKSVPTSAFSMQAHWFLLIMFLLICLFYLVSGYLQNDCSFQGMKKLTEKSEPSSSCFKEDHSLGIAKINVGLNGLIVLGILLVFDISFSGPVMGGLFTILGFSAYGKHVRNTWPPMLGVLIMVVLFDVDLSVGIILAVLFSTALAPLAGEHGFLVGLLSGMVHLPVLLGLSGIHGGILLYTNGFAAAFTAVIMDTLIKSYKGVELELSGD